MDDFWLTMESEAIEQAAFPTDIPITRVDASIIAPFIPPLMRGATVINTEKEKVQAAAQKPAGAKLFETSAEFNHLHINSVKETILLTVVMCGKREKLHHIKLRKLWMDKDDNSDRAFSLFWLGNDDIRISCKGWKF